MSTQKQPRKRGNQNQGKHRVVAHPRQNQSGRVSRVKAHDRPNRGTTSRSRNRSSSQRKKPVLQPSRARSNLRRAVKLRKRNGRKAAGFALAAVIELSAFVFVQSTILLIAAVATLLAAAALVIEDVTNGE